MLQHKRLELQNSSIANLVKGKTFSLDELKQLLIDKVGKDRMGSGLFVMYKIIPIEVFMSGDLYKLEFKYQPYNSSMYVKQDSKAKRKEGYNGIIMNQMLLKLHGLMMGELLNSDYKNIRIKF